MIMLLVIFVVSVPSLVQNPPLTDSDLNLSIRVIKNHNISIVSVISYAGNSFYDW